ncbi:hypothetical protein CN157_19490 [Sinorhizobium meliloti]|nr:hypothetical protein CN157_19490 [Sinorhizobium meliloti]RVQ76952.1 hypothetical protein CN061_10695 [Sinorhizobium meliloti]
MNDRNGGAMLPFTDLSVDVALGADRVLLPRALRGMLLCCSLFGPRRSHNVSTGSQKRQEDVRLVRVVELTRTCDC